MSHPEDTSNNRKISNSNNSSKEILASSEECRKQVTFKEETVSLPKIKVFHEYTINADRPNCMDVNSNSLLLSNVTYRNKVQDAETRKIIADLSDQMKSLKNECDRKDQLIKQISTSRETVSSTRIEAFENAQAESMFAMEKIQNYKRDFESKYEKLAYELYEERAKNSVKKEEIAALKLELNRYKEELFSFDSAHKSDILRVIEQQSSGQNCTSVSAKSGIVIASLQSDIYKYQTEVADLDSKLKSCLLEKESLERLCNSLKEKVSCLTNEQKAKDNHKFSDLSQKVSQVESEYQNLKASCARLETEVTNLEQSETNSKSLIETLRAERDTNMSSKKLLESDVENLKNKLAKAQDVWLDTQKELDAKNERYAKYDAEIKDIEEATAQGVKKLKSFKETLAVILSDDYVTCCPLEEEIKEKIKLLMISSKHRGQMIASLEKQVHSMNAQLTEEIKLSDAIKLELETFKAKVNVFEKKNMQSDIAANQSRLDIQRMEIERCKFYEFIEKLVNIYKLPISSAAIHQTSIEKNIELILSRISDEITLCSGAKSALQTIEFDRDNYEMKLNAFKEQLANKDIHLNLLRKKITDYEEIEGKSRDTQDQSDSSKKLVRKIERLTEENSKLREDSITLKAKLVDITALITEKNHKEAELRKLCEHIFELEAENNQNLIKVANWRSDFEAASLDLEKTRSSSDSVIKALSLEIRALKFEMEKMQKRTSQLLDFRNTVVNKLGLDLNTLGLADYQIVSRIENLCVQQVTPCPTVLTSLCGSSQIPIEAIYPCVAASSSSGYNHLTINNLQVCHHKKNAEGNELKSSESSSEHHHLHKQKHHGHKNVESSSFKKSVTFID